MTDIFVSYAREDRTRAELLAHALEAEGWSVWWDLSIPAGQTFDEVIERALDTARCVIVLWSKESVVNRWVRTEAEEGVARGVLVPVLIDEVKIPLAFRRIQAANLVEWKGDKTAPAYSKLMTDISSVLARHSSFEARSAQPDFGGHEGQRVTTGSTEPVNSSDVDEERRDVPLVNERLGSPADERQPEEVRRSFLGGDEREHYAEEPRATTNDTTSPIRFHRARQVALILQATATVAFIIGAIVDVESIVISGPFVAVVGGYLLWLGLRSRARTTQIAGAYGPAMGLVCLLIIVLTGWSPGEAQRPMSVLIAILGAPYGLWLLSLFRSLSHTAHQQVAPDATQAARR